ncbi:MAG: peptide deformylase [Candidatus Acidiferrales bacterium]
MRLKIVQAGEPVLRQAARALTDKEIRSDEIQRLIRDMHETMTDAPGVGLAAPQVGLGIQLAMIEDREDLLKSVTAEDLAEKERRSVPFHVIINPKLTPAGDEHVEFYEGCLSLAGFMGTVARARRVRVDCLGADAKPRTIEASGWYARILQHEIDHLHGTLYIDRMRPRTFTTLDNFTRCWKGKPIPE